MELSYGFTEDQIFRYLLGQLDGPDCNALEERYFADPLFFEYINAMEDHFIDTFLQEKMTWWKRRQFRKFYFTSPSRREKVALALGLMQVAGPGANGPVRADLGDLIQRARGRTSWLWAGAAITMLAVSFILGMALRSSRVELHARNEQLQELRHVVPDHSMISVHLEPGIPRGPEHGTERVAIPAATQVIQIELDAKILDASGRYRATLREATGEVVLEQGHLPVQQINGSSVVLLPVSASLLALSDYLIILEREDEEGHFVRAASYGLTLARR